MTDNNEITAQDKLEKLEDSITDFIKQLAASVIPDLEQIDPEIRAAFLLKALQIINKGND